MKQGKKFTTWINYTKYEPWDDIVGEMDEQAICVQLKHNEKLDKEKLRICLEKRKTLLEQHGRDSLIFIYFATTPGK